MDIGSPQQISTAAPPLAPGPVTNGGDGIACANMGSCDTLQGSAMLCGRDGSTDTFQLRGQVHVLVEHGRRRTDVDLTAQQITPRPARRRLGGRLLRPVARSRPRVLA